MPMMNGTVRETERPNEVNASGEAPKHVRTPSRREKEESSQRARYWRKKVDAVGSFWESRVGSVGSVEALMVLRALMSCEWWTMIKYESEDAKMNPYPRGEGDLKRGNDVSESESGAEDRRRTMRKP